MFQALKSLLNLLRRDLIAGWEVMGTAGMKSKGECLHSFTQLTTQGLTLGKNQALRRDYSSKIVLEGGCRNSRNQGCGSYDPVVKYVIAEVAANRSLFIKCRK